jgi:hypothetical protein
MIPNGDRHHSTESGGVIDKKTLVTASNDDIVRVFVLNDHMKRSTHLLGKCPVNYLFERGVGQHRGQKFVVFEAFARRGCFRRHNEENVSSKTNESIDSVNGDTHWVCQVVEWSSIRSSKL